MGLPLVILLTSLGIYLAIGVVVGTLFCFRGVQTVDPAAQHAPVGFRLIILPAAAALWPWVLLIWRRRSPNQGAAS